jgi:hypothetical protein
MGLARDLQFGKLMLYQLIYTRMQSSLVRVRTTSNTAPDT